MTLSNKARLLSPECIVLKWNVVADLLAVVLPELSQLLPRWNHVVVRFGDRLCPIKFRNWCDCCCSSHISVRTLLRRLWKSLFCTQHCVNGGLVSLMTLFLFILRPHVLEHTWNIVEYEAHTLILLWSGWLAATFSHYFTLQSAANIFNQQLENISRADVQIFTSSYASLQKKTLQSK